MFTDMVGYTGLTQANESLAMKVLERHNGLLRPIFPKFHGREIKTIGDSFLVEFGSALDAVRCAVEMQTQLHDFEGLKGQKIRIRIGIHLGDVIHRAGDVFGDAVNIASRLESLAPPEGIVISEQVFVQVRNKEVSPLIPLGAKEMKNVSELIQVYRVQMPWEGHGENGGDARPSVLEAHRVAVLPFVNISSDKENEYFADGLTEELIGRLGQIRELEVIARTSVMTYKMKEKKIAEIARELNVGSIVEGSVRRAGSRIRVTAQLIDANTDHHLWSSNYDRDLSDIFLVQSDIAEQVADALRVRLLPSERNAIEKKATEDLDAYNLYLKAKYHWNERTRESLEKAIRYLEEAIKKDPAYALAYSLLADTQAMRANYGFVDSREALTIARRYGEKALQLDPSLSEAHLGMATVLWNEWKRGQSTTEFLKAIELNPSNASARHRLAMNLALTGRLDEALDEIRRARDLDPLSPIISTAASSMLIRMGRYEEATQEIEESLKIFPDFYNLYAHLGLALTELGRHDEAIATLRKAVALSGKSDSAVSDLAVAYALAGKGAEAKRILNDLLESRKTRFVSAVDIAAVYAALGKNDEAISWLEVAYEEKSGQLSYVTTDPVFVDALGEDPRFINLVEELQK